MHCFNYININDISKIVFDKLKLNQLFIESDISPIHLSKFCILVVNMA